MKVPCLCPAVRSPRALPAGVGERGEGYQQEVLGEVFSEIDGDTMSSFQIPSAKARWPCSVKCTPSYARSTPHAPPYQSGQMDIHSRSISKRGSASLRRTLFLVMGVILQCAPMNEPVYQFMDKKRSEGKPYRVYMMASANKFLRIYYASVKAYLDSLEHD